MLPPGPTRHEVRTCPRSPRPTSDCQIVGKNGMSTGRSVPVYQVQIAKSHNCWRLRSSLLPSNTSGVHGAFCTWRVTPDTSTKRLNSRAKNSSSWYPTKNQEPHRQLAQSTSKIPLYEQYPLFTQNHTIGLGKHFELELHPANCWHEKKDMGVLSSIRFSKQN